MQEQIKDLINTIVSGDVAKAQDQFKAIAMAKTSDALDQLRVDTAKSMFREEQ